MKMKKNVFIAVVLGILVVISAIQAISLAKTKENIADSGLSVKSSRVSTPTQSSGDSGESPALPSNINNLPGMVGGC